MSLCRLKLSPAEEKRPQVVVGFGEAGIEPQCLRIVSCRLVVFPSGIEHIPQVVVCVVVVGIEPQREEEMSLRGIVLTVKEKDRTQVVVCQGARACSMRQSHGPKEFRCHARSGTGPALWR